MKHLNFCFILAASFAMLASCGTTAKEEQAIKLDYESYTLPNGLEVVLHEDKSDPVVAVAIQYHVGSSREKTGKTGFAHFFEHMLFQRSENLPRNAFFQKIDQMGGTFNGSTGPDGTNYFEVVPRDALEKVLWMESDRMGFFINTVTEGGLKREIDIVSNEKRQGENRPYAFVYDIMCKQFYPAGHPYSWTVIGEIPDLRSATLEDVKEFYAKYYTPNNATLVIAGDFDKAQVKELVDKYFGEIQSREKPEIRQPMPVAFDSIKKLYYEDNYASSPLLVVAYSAVESNNADEFALDFMTDLIAGSKKSPMYKVLVEEKKLVPEVSMYNQAQELSGGVSIEASTFKDVNLNDVYAGIEEAMARFESDGFSDADLSRLKIQKEKEIYNRLSGVMNKALYMAHDNVFYGAPDESVNQLAKYEAVTRDDIMRVYNKYIKGQNYGAISVVPKGQANLVLAGSVEAPITIEKVEDQKKQSTDGALVDDPYEFSPSKIDRKTEPALLANTPVVKSPAMWSTATDNGMKVLGAVYSELPLVNFMFSLNNGRLNDPAQKVGVSTFLARMLNEGTANKTPEELEDAMGQLGASIKFAAGSETMSLSGNCLKKNTAEVMALVQEMLLQPRWDAKAFETVKARLIDEYNQSVSYPQTIGRQAFVRMIYGKESPLAYIGTEATYSAITMDDLKDYYNKYISPSIAKFNIVGDFSQEEVLKMLAPLNTAWAAKEATQAIPEMTKATPDAKIFFIDYPGSAQSFIMLGNAAMPLNSPEAYPAKVVNNKLGGSSGSVLFDELRLKKGYTYGAYSDFNQGNYINNFVAASNVEAQFTVPSVVLFKDILSGWKEQFTEAILVETKNSMMQAQCGAFETPGRLINVLSNVSVYNMPMDYLTQQQNTLKNMTLDQAKAHIAKDINYDNMIIVVVGDAKTQLPLLQKSGIGKVVVLDRQSNIVK